MDKIRKLIDSNNEDDLLIGVELLYKHYKGNRDDMAEFIKSSQSTARLDIYIGDLNVVFYGGYCNSEVYSGDMMPLANARTVKL